MKRIIPIAIVLISAIACGTPSPMLTVMPPPASTSAPAATVTPTIPATSAPSQQSFSGSSNQATALFPLRIGPARFDMTHTGESNYIVRLLDHQGNEVRLVGNSIGTGDTSKVIRIEADGQYLLNVQADGAWTITVSQ